jgi:hypothetical protein
MQRENPVGERERKRARVGFVLLVVLSEGAKYKETDGRATAFFGACFYGTHSV